MPTRESFEDTMAEFEVEQEGHNYAGWVVAGGIGTGVFVPAAIQVMEAPAASASEIQVDTQSGTAIVTIERGDTLSKVATDLNAAAKAAGVETDFTDDQLASDNGIADKDVIFEDKRLEEKIPTGPTSEKPSDEAIYTVKKLDTVWDIANGDRALMDAIIKRNDIPVRHINGIEVAVLVVGRDLVIPKVVAPDPQQVQEVQVKIGDTLSEIAATHHIPQKDLEKANPQIENPELITTEDVIRIPAKPNAPVAMAAAPLGPNEKLSEPSTSTNSPAEKPSEPATAAPPNEKLSEAAEGPALSKNVPADWAEIFVKAATKYGINPNHLAGIFMTEQGNTWKPLDSDWASSPVGASGPFQFMPATWEAYKTHPDADINNPQDAADAAANLLSKSGADINTPLGDINQPFKDGTFLHIAAGYNAGPKRISDMTNDDSPASAGPEETERYVKNMFTVVSSDFTESGISNYKAPHLPDGSKVTPPAPTPEPAPEAAPVLSPAEKPAEPPKEETPAPPPAPTPEQIELFTRGLVIGHAKEYEGVSEGSGPNHLAEELFSGGRTERWCADYVTTILKDAGLLEKTEASTVNLLNIFRRDPGKEVFSIQQIREGVYPPKPGDVIWYYYSGGNPNEVNHVGIITHVDGKNITTIEGNVSDMVAERHTTIDSSSVRYIGRILK